MTASESKDQIKLLLPYATSEPQEKELRFTPSPSVAQARYNEDTVMLMAYL